MHIKARLAESEFDKNTNISVRMSKALPGSTLHGHDFYELEIVTDGETNTVLNGNEYTVGRGTVFFLSPTDFHEYKYQSTFDLYKIQFTSEAVSSSILERILNIGVNKFTLNEHLFEKICALASVMNGINDIEHCDRILTRILESILLMLTDSSASDTAQTLPSEAPDESIQRAMMYIHSHFKENPSLSEVADTVHLNSRYFCTKFREYTGKTYKEYLRGVKLRYARRLVIATSLPIIDIAENSGYSAQSHFDREFKEHYGVSPLAMRKRQDGSKYS